MTEYFVTPERPDFGVDRLTLWVVNAGEVSKKEMLQDMYFYAPPLTPGRQRVEGINDEDLKNIENQVKHLREQSRRRWRLWHRHSLPHPVFYLIKSWAWLVNALEWRIKLELETLTEQGIDAAQLPKLEDLLTVPLI